MSTLNYLARTRSGAVYGVDAIPVEIEVCASMGSTQFTIVGLPDQAVREAKDRVLTAVCNSGFGACERTITVNLAPANVKKEGPLYDLPIAVALLQATGKIKCPNLTDIGMIGELALSGEVRKVKGALPIALSLRDAGVKKVLVPHANTEEVAIVKGIEVYSVRTLREAVGILTRELIANPIYADLDDMIAQARFDTYDFADVKGQNFARRAIEVAVAGGHNIIMIGSPGAGKTMLARRIPSILPPLSTEEALEVARIHSVAGPAKTNSHIMLRRPFRAPHHTVSSIGLIGGGAHPTPGEISLAHRGVLFLDEFPEFPRNALEVLRQPLEDGHVSIARASAACEFPGKFMLVAAMNPCPCGYYDDPKRQCRCTRSQRIKYRNRISGPLLDRIDIQIRVPPVTPIELANLPTGESSAAIRARVTAARAIQQRRYASLPGVHCNADIKSRDLGDFCRLDLSAQKRIKAMLIDLNLSARAYDRVLKVSRTIADLDQSEEVTDDHIQEASMFRSLDRCEDL